MRHLLAISVLAMSGCASWFSDDVEKDKEPPAQAEVMIQRAFEAPTQEAFQRGVELAIQTSTIDNKKEDARAERKAKSDGMLEVVRVSAWAMGLGFVAFLFGGIIPVPGIKAAGGWTVALGAAIATLAPWLNDVLGDDQIRWAGYAAFGILAAAISIGGAWWFLDKVRDAVRRR